MPGQREKNITSVYYRMGTDFSGPSTGADDRMAEINDIVINALKLGTTDEKHRALFKGFSKVLAGDNSRVVEMLSAQAPVFHLPLAESVENVNDGVKGKSKEYLDRYLKLSSDYRLLLFAQIFPLAISGFIYLLNHSKEDHHESRDILININGFIAAVILGLEYVIPPRMWVAAAREKLFSRLPVYVVEDANNQNVGVPLLSIDVYKELFIKNKYVTGSQIIQYLYLPLSLIASYFISELGMKQKIDSPQKMELYVIAVMIEILSSVQMTLDYAVLKRLSKIAEQLSGSQDYQRESFERGHFCMLILFDLLTMVASYLISSADDAYTFTHNGFVFIVGNLLLKGAYTGNANRNVITALKLTFNNNEYGGRMAEALMTVKVFCGKPIPMPLTSMFNYAAVLSGLYALTHFAAELLHDNEIVPASMLLFSAGIFLLVFVPLAELGVVSKQIIQAKNAFSFEELSENKRPKGKRKGTAEADIEDLETAVARKVNVTCVILGQQKPTAPNSGLFDQSRPVSGENQAPYGQFGLRLGDEGF